MASTKLGAENYFSKLLGWSKELTIIMYVVLLLDKTSNLSSWLEEVYFGTSLLND